MRIIYGLRSTRGLNLKLKRQIHENILMHKEGPIKTACATQALSIQQALGNGLSCARPCASCLGTKVNKIDMILILIEHTLQ